MPPPSTSRKGLGTGLCSKHLSLKLTVAHPGLKKSPHPVINPGERKNQSRTRMTNIDPTIASLYLNKMFTDVREAFLHIPHNFSLVMVTWLVRVSNILDGWHFWPPPPVPRPLSSDTWTNWFRGTTVATTSRRARSWWPLVENRRWATMCTSLVTRWNRSLSKS